MKLKNEAMLITYPDSLGHNIKDLEEVVDRDFKGAIGGIHLLPFFPSAGDRGFSPMDYRKVEPAFGDWSDVEELGEKYYLMFDFMINHISSHSPEFQDVLKNGKDSKYYDMFLDWDAFWPKGRPTQEDVDLIYKRKDKAPVEEFEVKGEKLHFWNTFGPDQIDWDVRHQLVQKFIKQTLNELVDHGASLIRLDAFAYAIKKLDENDFFVEPEIWDLLEQVKQDLGDRADILPEIHEHYTMPFKVAKHGYFIYDFVLPMVTLYTLYSGKTDRLAAWLKQVPMKQFTTLDTHDGIGVVDAKDILTDDELEYTVDQLYKVGANVSRKYSSAAYHNLDIYQINTTYYSALGNDDLRYFIARLIQVFAPGIPQIYYVGLLAGENDLELLEKTKEGRNINRHYYTKEEVAEEVKRPVVAKLLNLLRFRNQAAAFDLEGAIKVETPSENELTITRQDKTGQHEAKLTLNVKDLTYSVENDGKVVEF